MKVILFANTDWYLYNFRLPLAQALQERGDEVLLLSPAGPYVERLRAAGFRWQEFSLDRKGTNPLVDGLALLKLWRLYRREKPDLVHHFTIKCVLYGSMAAWLAGVKITVNAITGLGYAFTGNRKWLRIMVSNLYRLLLRGTWVIFQNPDDQSAFVQKGLVDPARSVLIRGSGVDTIRFQPSPEPEGIPLVILPARMLWEKGIGEFVEAASILKECGVEARFALVGDTDTGNAFAVPTEKLQEWKEKKLVEWWGWQDDMTGIYAQAHIVCLPSYYGEGIPKTLIEAAACGRPLVAADMPGSREIVRNRENGLLVPPRSGQAVADALQVLIRDPELRKEMGQKGRQIAVGEFDLQHVLRNTLEFYTTATIANVGQNGI